jgi:hypothetical protein
VRPAGIFLYNKDKKGHPAPGAPPRKWGDIHYKNVCSVCASMINNPKFMTDYWQALKRKDEERRKHKDKLKSDGEYFS